ncbi:hypothetical protein FAIPA1_20031 [Frankia sp. AiPs1]
MRYSRISPIGGRPGTNMLLGCVSESLGVDEPEPLAVPVPVPKEATVMSLA